MDIKQVKELIQLFEKSGVHKLTVKDKSGLEVMLEKAPHTVESPPLLPPPAKKHPPVSMQAPTGQGHKISHEQEEGIDPKKCIKSPMVGTFYRSETPGAKPFTQKGERVKVGQTLCIIEAMKMMNEIKADRDGEVKGILVEDGHPVEYGQLLFHIE